MIKHTLTAAAFAAILASPAFAQVKQDDAAQSSMANNQNAATHSGFVQNQHATEWRGSKLIGALVYGPDNASIGTVNDVLIGNDSSVRAVVIGVGGFLGVGEKNVAVPLDGLNITRKPDSSAIDKISVTYTKADLKNAPQFVYDDSTPSPTTGSGVTDKIKSLNPLGDQKQ
jgi:hypothetical protein